MVCKKWSKRMQAACDRPTQKIFSTESSLVTPRRFLDVRQHKNNAWFCWIVLFRSIVFFLCGFAANVSQTKWMWPWTSNPPWLFLNPRKTFKLLGFFLPILWFPMMISILNIESAELDTLLSGWWLSHPSEKYESQLGWLFPTYGSMESQNFHVPNHQPVYKQSIFASPFYSWENPDFLWPCSIANC